MRQQSVFQTTSELLGVTQGSKKKLYCPVRFTTMPVKQECARLVYLLEIPRCATRGSSKLLWDVTRNLHGVACGKREGASQMTPPKLSDDVSLKHITEDLEKHQQAERRIKKRGLIQLGGEKSASDGRKVEKR